MLDDGRVSAERRAGASASYLNPFALETVEIVRGPGSVAYGSDALGGVVHARTPMPTPGVFGLGTARRGHRRERRRRGRRRAERPRRARPPSRSTSTSGARATTSRPSGTQDNSAVRDRGLRRPRPRAGGRGAALGRPSSSTRSATWASPRPTSRRRGPSTPPRTPPASRSASTFPDVIGFSSARAARVLRRPTASPRTGSACRTRRRRSGTPSPTSTRTTTP